MDDKKLSKSERASAESVLKFDDRAPLIDKVIYELLTSTASIVPFGVQRKINQRELDLTNRYNKEMSDRENRDRLDPNLKKYYQENENNLGLGGIFSIKDDNIYR